LKLLGPPIEIDLEKEAAKRALRKGFMPRVVPSDDQYRYLWRNENNAPPSQGGLKRKKAPEDLFYDSDETELEQTPKKRAMTLDDLVDSDYDSKMLGKAVATLCDSKYYDSDETELEQTPKKRAMTLDDLVDSDYDSKMPGTDNPKKARPEPDGNAGKGKLFYRVIAFPHFTLLDLPNTLLLP
jgi:hypothetical protein